MEINRRNIEAYLLDYSEGNLTPEEVNALREYLLLHPDIPGGKLTGEALILHPGDISYPSKQQLKKSIPDEHSIMDASNMDLLSIAYHEHDLTPRQVEEYEKMLENNEQLQTISDGWSRIKLPPEEIKFPSKKRLKKRVRQPARIIGMSVIAAAASLALLLALLRWNTVQVSEPFTEGVVASEQPSVKNEPADKNGSTRLAENPMDLSTPENDSPGKTEEPSETVNRLTAGIASQSILPVETASDNEPTGNEVFIIAPAKIRELPMRISMAVPFQGTRDQIRPLRLPPSSIHVTSLSLTQLATLDLSTVFEDYTEETDLTLFEVAKAGIKGINRLTGAQMSLLASQDEDGEVSGIRFKSKRLSVETPVQPKDQNSD